MCGVIPCWSRSAIPCDSRLTCKLDTPNSCNYMNFVIAPARILVALVKITCRMQQQLVTARNRPKRAPGGSGEGHTHLKRRGPLQFIPWLGLCPLRRYLGSLVVTTPAGLLVQAGQTTSKLGHRLLLLVTRRCGRMQAGTAGWSVQRLHRWLHWVGESFGWSRGEDGSCKAPCSGR